MKKLMKMKNLIFNPFDLKTINEKIEQEKNIGRKRK